MTHEAPRKILIVQTDFEDGVRSAQLIASAKCVFVLPPETTGEPQIHSKFLRNSSQKTAQPQTNVEQTHDVLLSRSRRGLGAVRKGSGKRRGRWWPPHGEVQEGPALEQSGVQEDTSWETGWGLLVTTSFKLNEWMCV